MRAGNVLGLVSTDINLLHGLGDELDAESVAGGSVLVFDLIGMVRKYSLSSKVDRLIPRGW